MIRPALARLRLQQRFRVLIAESHELVRLGLCSLLAGHRSLEVVGEVSTVAGAVAVVVERRPELVVMASMLGDGTGLDGCREILARVPDTRVVILGERADEMATRAAARAGALGLAVALRRSRRPLPHAARRRRRRRAPGRRRTAHA